MESGEEVLKDEVRYRSQAESAESEVQTITYSSRDLSGPISNSQDGPNPGGNSLEQHHNMMLASLLEDYYRTRAAEFLNTADPGHNYTRNSEEIQPLARRLFSQASTTLVSNGFVSDLATSEGRSDARREYLSGLDALAAGAQAPNATISSPIHDLIMQASHLNLTPSPSNDQQLTIQPPLLQIPSRYQSSFAELSLLGKGGFGKVYKCLNRLDQSIYAVKKIAISPKLEKSLIIGRYEDLTRILREVQALAKLDHPNIVRYHATWFENLRVSQAGPIYAPRTASRFDFSTTKPSEQPRPLLLDNRPFDEYHTSTVSQTENNLDSEEGFDTGDEPIPGHTLADDVEIVFGEDTLSNSEAADRVSEITRPGWTEQAIVELQTEETTSVSESNVFTDGRTPSEVVDRGKGEENKDRHVLYIQMSMYPMTLAQYISPNPGQGGAPRHCFHLIPTLRVLLSILNGLQYIHLRGLVHRDIKPGNIFLSTLEVVWAAGYCDVSCRTCSAPKDPKPCLWMNPRIGDFGLVAELAHEDIQLESASEGPSTTAKPVGTAYYQSPFQGGVGDEKTDIYALGVVLVEMLCPCGTKMERIDILKGLQKGEMPVCLRENLKREGYSHDIIDGVITLVRAMVEPNSRDRWEGARVETAAKKILARCD